MEFVFGVVYQTEANATETALWPADKARGTLALDGNELVVELETLCKAPMRLRARVAAKRETNRVKQVIVFSAPHAQILPGYRRDDCVLYSDWDHVWEHALTGAPGDADMRAQAIQAAGLIRKCNHNGVALGFQAPVKQAAHFEYTQTHTRALEYVRSAIAPGAPFVTDELLVTPEMHFSAALRLLRASDAPRKALKDIRKYFGYNTFEAYHDMVTENDIRREIKTIRETPLLRDNIHYFIIDSGWQVRDGYYTVCRERFPGGMENIAREIAQAGMVPGIWTGPLRVPLGERLMTDHPDWFLYANGEQLTNETSKKLGILDITNPAVLDFLRGLYARLRGWGYRYFKVDFLKEAAMFSTHGNWNYREDVNYFDKSITIEDAMSRLYKTIREAVGEDSFLMACGTHLMADCSVFDASRSGGDISAFWARVPVQAADVTRRFALHGQTFLIDPDFCVLTSPDTVAYEGDAHLPQDRPYVFNTTSGAVFTLEEARSWLTFVIMSGGLVNLSDRLFTLKPEALALLRTVYAYAGGESALPVDAANRMPCVYARRRDGGNLLAVINWTDEEKVFHVHLPGLPVAFREGGLFDVWADAPARAENGLFSCRLAPHACRLLVEANA